MTRQLAENLGGGNVWHHHNSVRFKCQCGRKHGWCEYQRAAAKRDEIRVELKCDCGRVHIKHRKNFRGEG